MLLLFFSFFYIFCNFSFVCKCVIKCCWGKKKIIIGSCRSRDNNCGRPEFRNASVLLKVVYSCQQIRRETRILLATLPGNGNPWGWIVHLKRWLHTLWRLEFLAYQPCRLLPVPASPGNELPDAYENIVFFKSILAYFSRKREVYKLCYRHHYHYHRHFQKWPIMIIYLSLSCYFFYHVFITIIIIIIIINFMIRIITIFIIFS